MMSLLDRKLPLNEQREVLGQLLAFQVSDEGVILDQDGDELYGQSTKHDLTNLRGIIEYIESESFREGYNSCRCDINQILNNPM